MLQEALSVVRELNSQNQQLWLLLLQTQKSRDKWEGIARQAVAALEKVAGPSEAREAK